MQCGRPDEVYARPSSLFAARLMSEINELPGTCRDGRLETALGWFDAPGLPAGARATACIRPEQLRVSLVPSGVRARVAESTFLGDADQLTVALDGHASPLIVTVGGRAPVRAGDVVYVDVAHADVLVFPNP
jgi:iron(III) transport system ATP-binding protein